MDSLEDSQLVEIICLNWTRRTTDDDVIEAVKKALEDRRTR
jgi:hypothetical protein